jgi:hypothetical protein
VLRHAQFLPVSLFANLKNHSENKSLLGALKGTVS